ncbi:MAG: zinc metallopeptidase [Actinobacteria bacterium]|nr:zinc metallopeptidase [Actinomycetota bacterium]
MKWKRGSGRTQIEDRRGQAGGFGGFGSLGGSGGGGGFPLPRGGAGMGLGGLVLLGVILFALFSTGALGGGGSSESPPGSALSGAPDAQSELADFVAFVVNDIQTWWQQDFRGDGRTYQVTKLVLFEGGTQSGCGAASSDTGPFYCPVDRKVYLDLDFFRELQSRFQAPGDFAQAYVIAHEFGHHVQTLLGTEQRVREEQQRSPSEANELSVRMELQADCYAGAWANSAYEQGQLESGDLQEGLAAASAVGDDRIQRGAGERVNPETWTHGSSEQRVQWFQIGFEDGEPGDCDTFSASI